jgi:hypothetical protein
MSREAAPAPRPAGITELQIRSLEDAIWSATDEEARSNPWWLEQYATAVANASDEQARAIKTDEINGQPAIWWVTWEEGGGRLRTELAGHRRRGRVARAEQIGAMSRAIEQDITAAITSRNPDGEMKRMERIGRQLRTLWYMDNVKGIEGEVQSTLEAQGTPMGRRVAQTIAKQRQAQEKWKEEYTRALEGGGTPVKDTTEPRGDAATKAPHRRPVRIKAASKKAGDGGEDRKPGPAPENGERATPTPPEPTPAPRRRTSRRGPVEPLAESGSSDGEEPPRTEPKPAAGGDPTTIPAAATEAPPRRPIGIRAASRKAGDGGEDRKPGPAPESGERATPTPPEPTPAPGRRTSRRKPVEPLAESVEEGAEREPKPPVKGGDAEAADPPAGEGERAAKPAHRPIEIGAVLKGGFGATISSGMNQLSKLGSTIKQLEASSKNIGKFTGLQQVTLPAWNKKCWDQLPELLLSLVDNHFGS